MKTVEHIGKERKKRKERKGKKEKEIKKKSLSFSFFVEGTLTSAIDCLWIMDFCRSLRDTR